MSYHQLTSSERSILAHLKWQGHSLSEIARQLGRDKSTISREVRRNRVKAGWYIAFAAQKMTNGRRRRSRKFQHFSYGDFMVVDAFLRCFWSPEQIAGRFRLKGILNISHATIYHHVWENQAFGGDLHRYLRQGNKRYRKRHNTHDSRGKMTGKRHISERPISAENRSRFGHTEVDTVMGRGSKHCLLTVVDRKSGLTRLAKLKARTTDELNAGATRVITRSTKPLRTMTADNGTEFHGYEQIEKTTDVKFYFANPYHSWERGTNENTNGLIRQYLPKGKSMRYITEEHAIAIEKGLNTRPRKRYGYRTPEEVENGEW